MRAPLTLPRQLLRGVAFNVSTEAEVVAAIVQASSDGHGGWVVTPNVDIMRAIDRDRSLLELVAGADVVVADGMPLVWASRLAGTPLPERVTGASLIWSLTEAAGAAGRSVYLLGGAAGVPQRAARALSEIGGIIAGAYSPPMGFDRQPDGYEEVRRRLIEAGPEIVFCGFGFPKQEHLIASLRDSLPGTWFIGCGAAVAFAAGDVPRAPEWMQRHGVEWCYRLVAEPRRLARRYLVDDLPYAVRLLTGVLLERVRERKH
ncbi:MAG TPA: WecB/TagA/CpsF family glycosyltransferase [Kribbella sp.]|jgi:N-acetylglucosaminyldiphosphoundecaprenol N-acetyl-beta-D-mannosaminyltransferase